MSDEIQQVVITAPAGAVDDDDVAVIINDATEWRGWQVVRITRGIERMPNDFEVTFTENFPGSAAPLVAKPGDSCSVVIGTTRVLFGYINEVSPAINGTAHTITLAGRGRCQDLVDCAAYWPGSIITAQTVLQVAKSLCSTHPDLEAVGESGPEVGDGSRLIPYLAIMLGETSWEVIDRICKIAGLLAYENADGNLVIASVPTSTDAATATSIGKRAASGFAEGVNVQAAAARYTDAGRYATYTGYWYNFDPLRDLPGTDVNLISVETDAGARSGRNHVLLAEVGKTGAEENMRRRLKWEATRRFGQSRQVVITTDAWRDSAGQLYEPGTTMPLDLPSLHLDSAEWIVSEVTYRRDAQGTHADLLLMPLDAFAPQPTLPPQQLPEDLARMEPKP